MYGGFNLLFLRHRLTYSYEIRHTCMLKGSGFNKPTNNNIGQCFSFNQEPAGLNHCKLVYTHFQGAYRLFFSVFLRVCRFKNGQGSGVDGGHYSVHHNGTLEIKRARSEDEGTYTCVASSLLGKAENQVRLEVKGETPAGGAPATPPSSVG